MGVTDHQIMPVVEEAMDTSQTSNLDDTEQVDFSKDEEQDESDGEKQMPNE